MIKPKDTWPFGTTPVRSVLPNHLGIIGEQGGAFEHPAELLLADALMLAGAAPEILEGFVVDFQPFQMHDADVFLAAFPRLPLLELHALTVVFTAAVGQCQIVKW